jgi:DNA polymerase
MKDEIRKLSGRLKNFLLENGEEDLIRKAAPAARTGAALNLPGKETEFISEQQPRPAVREPADTTDKAAVLEELANRIKTCKRCPLGETRIKTVPGEGNINARLMFIGEGPGYDEDRQGRPFVGRAGQLLDKIIAAMGFKREEVFIGNMVKCHPMTDPSDPEKRGNDRAPGLDEIARCRRYIENQINAIGPDYIVALGGVAAKSLIRDSSSLSSIRGRLYNLELSEVQLKKTIKILATYHPAALLRNPGWKKDAWADLKVLMGDMGIQPPEAK